MMTARELYKALKASGTGDEKLRACRRWLRDAREDASGLDLMAHLERLAHDPQSPWPGLEGTLAKCRDFLSPKKADPVQADLDAEIAADEAEEEQASAPGDEGPGITIVDERRPKKKPTPSSRKKVPAPRKGGTPRGSPPGPQEPVAGTEEASEEAGGS